MLTLQKSIAVFVALATTLNVSSTTSFAGSSKSIGQAAECRLVVEKISDFEGISVAGVGEVINPQGWHDWLDLKIYAKASYPEPEIVFLINAVHSYDSGLGIARLRAECEEGYRFYATEAEVSQPSEYSPNLVLRIGGEITQYGEQHKWLEAKVTITLNQQAEPVFQLKKIITRDPKHEASQ